MYENIYNIKTIGISKETFIKDCYKALFSQSKIAYLSACENACENNMPFEKSLQKITSEPDRKYIKILISAETHQSMSELLKFLVKTFDPQLCYGIPNVFGEFQNIALYVAI